MEQILCTPEIVKELVEKNSKLVDVRWSKLHNGDYAVLKYSRHAFYQGVKVWDEHPWLQDMRGLVIDKNYKIVGRGYPKIFNYGEAAPKNQFDGGIATFDDHDPVSYAIKYNGFMCAVSYTEQEILVSTTGTLDSEYVDLAVEMLANTKPEEEPETGWSYLYEICHPKDPHIVVEQTGAHYIGKIEVASGMLHPKLWAVRRFGNLLADLPYAVHEGYVVYKKHEDGRVQALKLKTPIYLAHKKLARATKHLPDILSNPPVVVLPYVEIAKTPEFQAADEQERLKILRDFDRKVRGIY